MSEASLLREEIADLRAYLEGLPSELADGPYGTSYKARLNALARRLRDEELGDEAAAAGTHAMDLRLFGESIAQKHRVPAELIGELLQHWQGLFWALGQAAAGRPTQGGMIPRNVRRQTRLEVTAFAEGSFVARMILAQDEQIAISPEHNLGHAAIASFERLFEAGSDRHRLSVIFHQLQGRVMSSYAKLLRLLDEWEASLELSIAKPEDLKNVTRMELDIERVRRVLPALTDVEAEEIRTEELFVGILVAANSRTGSFEIDAGDVGMISGYAASNSILEGAAIGGLYDFHISQIVTSDPLTGKTEGSWVLQAMSDEPLNAPTRNSD